MVIAASQEIILMVMDRAIMKTLENHLKEKVGQTVQSMDTMSQVFIVVLGTGLKTLTHFDVVKWLQVTALRQLCTAVMRSKNSVMFSSLSEPFVYTLSLNPHLSYGIL